MNEIGAGYQYETPVYVHGAVTGGVLDGDLILVAGGDLTIGGRTDGPGTEAD